MKYNLEIIKEKFYDFGYILDADKYTSSSVKMPCHDKDGFRYMLNYDSVRTNRHPYRFHKSNKFAIENIQMILDRETDGVKILEENINNSRTKMKFLCSCGKEFYMPLTQFVTDGKRYCNSCAKSKRYDGVFDYNAAIKKKCNDSNYTLLSDNVTRSGQQFDYICNKHSEYGIQHSTYDRMINMNQGCYYCGIIKRGISHRIDKKTIINELNEKGFDYVDHHYCRMNENASSKVRIGYICRKHRDKGVQYIDWSNLKNNKVGCYYCAGYGRTHESLQREFDDLGKKITIIDFKQYSDIYVKCDICGNEWNTSGINILSGHGCPRCTKSNYEKTIEAILELNNIEYVGQYKFDDCRDKIPLPFDFYLPTYNTLIEVDGQHHYYPVNFNGMSDDEAFESFQTTIAHDKIKNQYCLTNGIPLVRIPFFIIDDKNINTEKYLLDRI